MFNEVEKMIDQEQVARTLINLIDVVHQENWVLLNTKDMANELNAKEMRDFMEPYRFLKTKYIHQSKGL